MNPEARLTAGAHLFDRGAEAVSSNDQGFVTSVGYSPALGHDLALGFVSRGMAREGERIRLVDHMRKVDVEVRVVNPVFLDPEGERVRG